MAYYPKLHIIYHAACVSGPGERRVAAVEENEWTPAGDLRLHDFAEEHDVVPGRNAIDDAALEGGQCSGNLRDTGLTVAPIDAVKARIATLRKAHREMLLMLGENVDADGNRLLETLDQTASQIDADHHQRWLRRYGNEGVGGETVGLSFEVASGDNCNSGGKLSADLAKLIAGNRSRKSRHA